MDDEFPMVSEPFYTGMLITGMTSKFDLCSTADDRLAYLNIALAARIHYVGQQPTHEEYTIRVPVTGTATIDEIIRRYTTLARPESPDPAAHDLHGYQLAIGLLLYLCSGAREIRVSPTTASGKQKSKKARTGTDTTVVDVGFDIGPKLFAAQRAERADRVASKETGATADLTSGARTGIRTGLDRVGIRQPMCGGYTRSWSTPSTAPDAPRSSTRPNLLGYTKLLQPPIDSRPLVTSARVKGAA